MAKKTIRQTGYSAAGGGTASGLIAIFIVEVFQWDLSPTGVAGFAVLLTVAGGLIGAYLAPSVQEKIDETVAEHMSKVSYAGEPVELLGPRPVTGGGVESIAGPEQVEPMDQEVQIVALQNLKDTEAYAPSHAGPVVEEVETSEELADPYPDLAKLAETK